MIFLKFVDTLGYQLEKAGFLGAAPYLAMVIFWVLFVDFLRSIRNFHLSHIGNFDVHCWILSRYVPTKRLSHNNTNAPIFQLWRFLGTNSILDVSSFFDDSIWNDIMHYHRHRIRCICLVWFLVSLPYF